MKYTPEYWTDVESIIKNIPNVDQLFGKTILITGATGMICSAVVDIIAYLNHNRKANIKLILAGRSKDRMTERFSEVLEETSFLFLEYDATKEQLINIKADYIIHGASNANPAIYAKEPVETLLGNIIGLNSLLQLAKRNQRSRLLYISSSEVYGNRVGGSSEPYREEDYGYVDILNPRACYPNGKRASETLCASYLQQYGVDYVIARPGHIYGPSITKSDTRASAEFTREVTATRDIVLKSAGAQLRSYCYTLDCASALLAVLINGKTGEAYNISNRNSVVSIRELAETFAALGNVKVIFEAPTDLESRSYNLMQNSALNSDKLEALGWKATFALVKGVRRTIQFY